MLPTISILGHSYSTQWTIFTVGSIFAVVMNLLRHKKIDCKKWQIVLVTVLSLIFSLLGAKILFYLENPHTLLEQGVRLGGVSFFGALFFVPIAFYGVAKIMGISYGKLMDFVSPSLMFMLTVLRLGCYFSGCCGGIAVYFAGEYLEQFPTQITEVVFDLLILIGLLLYEKFWDNYGRLYCFIMLYYGLVRFFLEFLRDTQKNWLGMSHGQWFAIISVIVSGYFLNRLAKMDRKRIRRGGKR